MAKTITLTLGVHNHQPVGNFEFVFQEAYEKSYRPFLHVLQRHPHVRIALHYTGSLLKWLLDRHPDTIELIKTMVARKQVEMLTGGLYEPIFSIIPDRDKLAQIQGLTTLTQNVIGYQPEGMWMAERVWEPHLPLTLSQAGVKYAILDDSHFKYAGLRDEDLLGYYITEEQGAPLCLFPISKKLRYTIPFQEPEETIEHLHGLATEDGGRVAIFADDGEKFGSWPETYEHCYTNGWLERFFGALEENGDWIQIQTFGELIHSRPPLGRIYLPTASYAEMMEWALPAAAIPLYEEFQKTLQEKDLMDRYGVYVRGGYWRNFLAKYPESNNMHKKMLAVSAKVQTLSRKRKPPDELETARDELFQGQCNDAYWHGVFGGLYLPHLRSAVYHHLLKAERVADEVLHSGDEWIDVQETDFDGDGRQEVLLHTPDQNLYLDPNRGGALFELDYKPQAINLLDTLARREEGYHHKLVHPHNPTGIQEEVASIHNRVTVKEEGLEKLLHYDWHRRSSLLDHFLGEETTLEAFSQSQYRELGDFVTEPYQHRLRRLKGRLQLRFFRDGHLWTVEGSVPITLSKTLSVPHKGTTLGIKYRLENRPAQPITLWFGVEFNFALLAGSAPDRNYWVDGHQLEDPRLVSAGEIPEAKRFGLRDEYLGIDIALTLSRPATLWRFPLETVSQSEGGFERVYQSSVVFPNWRIHLEPGEKWEVEIGQVISRLP
jgi:alpha-amylase